MAEDTKPNGTNGKHHDVAKTKEVNLAAAETEQAGCLLYVSAAEAVDIGKSFRLEAGEAVLGRDKDCDLVLLDESVSRHHARLVATSAGILVEDMGSTNGITYLGKRFGRATLEVGARLGVGSCTIDLLPLPDSEAMPLSTKESYGDLVGSSLPMRRLYASLELLEKSDAPVLVEGETGTGKELVARALHENGRRKGKPFVLIDCGNVPSYLMESELFGHRKGSFTGAVADRAGAFEAANTGTVFLDELGELPLELQPKLLRVLETGQVKRVGDVQHLPVDVRVIAATKRDLAHEVAENRFREDLFYRVAVVQLHLPPLRDRREDIPTLAQHLAVQISGGEVRTLPREAEEFFMHHDWPGNVRELRNVIQRMLALGVVAIGPQPKVGPTAASSEMVHKEWPLEYRKARGQAIDEFERSYLRDLMTRFEGNLSAAARAAGIDRKYLRDLLKKHGLY
jgi:DNA-binding NtrC family response regulator